MSLIPERSEGSLHCKKEQRTMWRFTLAALLSSICIPESVLASSVTVATSPVGLTILVDGVAATAPQTLSWATGSSHTLSVPSPQQGGTGTRYVFSGWSDVAAQTHTVTAPASDTAYTVTFTTQYLLTVTASPPGSGTFSFYPPSPDGYYNASTSPPSLVSIIPDATAGYLDHGWSGDVGGPFTFFIDPVIQVPMDHPRNVVGLFFKPVNVTLSRSSLNFGITSDLSLVTSPQTVTAKFSATSLVNWTTSGDPPHIISASPTSGSGDAAFQVSVSGIRICEAPIHCEADIVGTSATDAPGPGVIPVNVVVATIGPSYGSFDTPRDNATNLSGSIPVTGWALDSIEVTKVDLWREPMSGEALQSNGLVYLGDAAFVSDARPDIESVYPRAPLNYRAGWGYLLLTNLLPNVGNGTFRLHAIAHNKAGIATDLGAHTIAVDNMHASKPFGSIDTPAPNDTISGNAYVNFGWALTQNPYMIPTDGSTLTVYVDGIPVGHPTYNQYRSDIATLFPGLANSNGAVGFFYIDTTTLANGVHTIAWRVSDEAGRTDGIGSRYFTILNTGTGPVAAPEEPVQALPSGTVNLQRGFDLDHHPESLSRPETGEYVIHMEELESIELQVAAMSGHLMVNGELRPLPIGSTLKGGTFHWQAGPGFLGEFELVFERPDAAPVRVRVVIHPKGYLAVQPQ
jgi:hypothetical protein